MTSRKPVFAALLFVGLASASSSSRAQVFETRELGGGLSVRQVSTFAYCWGAATPCTVWEPQGFSFGDVDALRAATAFGRVPESGRIVAAITGTRAWRSVRSNALLYSDDGGVTWQAARWDWPVNVWTIAFESTGLSGVAAGDSGYVWITDDGGATWIDRGSSSGVRYVDAVRLGSTLVLVDDHGAAWRSRDRGFARETLADGVRAPLSIDAGSIVVTTNAGAIHVRRDGSVRRP